MHSFIRFCLALVLAAAAWAGAAPPAAAQDWRPLDPAAARLVLAPSAFGTRDVRRWALDTGAIRYERWSRPFDRSARFFQIVLRQASVPGLLVVPRDIRQMAVNTFHGNAAAITWDEAGTLATRLGTAQYQTFSLSGMGCAAFITGIGPGAGDPAPVDAVEGVYCDPATIRLPIEDIRATLDAIGVAGL